MRASKRQKRTDKVARVLCENSGSWGVHLNAWPVALAGEHLPFCGRCYGQAERVITALYD